MLTLHIFLDDIYEVAGSRTIKMILFHGTAEGPDFQGTVLPGGVDTQKSVPEGMMLSARYILEGTDKKGTPTRIFIENEGIAKDAEPLVTHPRIVTDNPALSYMEADDLTGTISNENDHLVIRIMSA